MIDFVTELWLELAIITNGSNLADLNKAEKTAKNIKSASLINKNVITVTTNPAVAKVKELKAQILKLKAEIKEAKYVLQEDRKQLQNIERNRKPSYWGPNHKLVNKKNLECYNCKKKSHFKSKCQAKLKGQMRDRIDYKNIWFLETDQPEVESSSDSEMEEVNLNHQWIHIHNWKYNIA